MDIARSVSASVGLSPAAAPALMPPVKPLTLGTRELVVMGCAFGNSLTLPLIFSMSLLTGADASKAAAFIALFLCGWSPLLWVFGYQLLSGLDPARQALAADSARRAAAAAASVSASPLDAIRLGGGKPRQDQQVA